MEKVFIHAPGLEFLIPYLRRELPGVAICGDDDITGADMAVMISSCDVYGDVEGYGITEDCPADRHSAAWAAETRFRELVSGERLRPLVLRCANIVGTGMTGLPARLAREIWRGMFFHLAGNDARISAVHASDVARVVALFAAKGLPAGDLTFNLTDGDDPTVHDFAEALAYRMDNKRISTLSTGPQRWFGRKFLYGARKCRDYTVSRTFSSGKLREATGFCPVAVTEYLRTHVYDENSL